MGLRAVASVVSARRIRIAFILSVVALLAVGTSVQAGAPSSEVERMSTQEYVAQQAWWPTKLLPSRKDYVGSAACAPCHASKVSLANNTEMTKALLRPEEAEVLKAHDGQSFRLDSYLYKLERTPQGHTFTVSHGNDSVSQPITWAFGDGRVSQVYVTEKQGKFYESHFSYYGGMDGFDRTTNQAWKADSLQTAVGRVVPPEEIRRCFSCHAAAVPPSGGFDEVMPGVTCEACHGPGADHVAAMKAHVEGGEGFIMNPAHLDRTASVDFCGACHLTWVDVELGGTMGSPSVRFPAYRLQNSRCWEKGDARVTCIACHDPHQPLQRDAAHYDKKCLACHVTGAGTSPTQDHPGKACPQSDHNCASCHMPKQNAPSSHNTFTDHDIRVVRAGEQVPD